MSPSGLLAALQLADSALPIGRFVHSQGLEAFIRAEDPGEAGVVNWIRSATLLGTAPLDGVAVALAHRATSEEELTALDRGLTARKLTPASRQASAACGRQLAALGLAREDALVDELAAAVRGGTTPGNVSVVLGATARALGVTRRDAVAIEVRGTAAGLLSASVRLGVLAPARAQLLLAELHPEIERAVDDALALELGDTFTCVPHLELHAMRHARLSGRLFRT
jgi:urease accessory protein